MTHSKRALLVFGVIIAPLVALAVKRAADEAALAQAGFKGGSDASVQQYFASCIRTGASPMDVARCMPPHATVDRYVAPTSEGDSLLLERYTYRAWLIGSWPVHIYYVPGGGVDDFYAQDQWPSLDGVRPVGAGDAAHWLRVTPRQGRGSHAPAT